VNQIVPLSSEQSVSGPGQEQVIYDLPERESGPDVANAGELRDPVYRAPRNPGIRSFGKGEDVHRVAAAGEELHDRLHGEGRAAVLEEGMGSEN